MSSGYLLDPKVSSSAPPPPAAGATAIDRLRANSAARSSSTTALQVVKPSPLAKLADLSLDVRERAGGCLVKTGTVLSTAVGSLAVIALTAAGVSLAGAGVAVTEVVAGGVALNWLFGWASRPLIAAGAVVLGEKPRAVIKRVLG